MIDPRFIPPSSPPYGLWDDPRSVPGASQAIQSDPRRATGLGRLALAPSRITPRFAGLGRAGASSGSIDVTLRASREAAASGNYVEARLLLDEAQVAISRLPFDEQSAYNDSVVWTQEVINGDPEARRLVGQRRSELEQQEASYRSWRAQEDADTWWGFAKNVGKDVASQLPDLGFGLLKFAGIGLAAYFILPKVISAVASRKE